MAARSCLGNWGDLYMAADGSIVIKKIKKGGGHGHHGGAWKVAYADFVTAMMAFFLLMWLINTTTPEQKRGIADYFAPSAVSKSESGAGGVLAGTSPAQDGAKSAGSAAFVIKLKEAEDEATKQREQGQASGTGQRGTENAQEQRAMDAASTRLRQALQARPELTELSKHVLIDQTEDGMRIQLVDQDGRSMFDPGSSEPTARVQRLLGEVARSIAPMSNRISISGHTDAQPFTGPGGYSNWDLSSARANAARRILEDNGLPQNRIAQVSGKAGSDPLYPDNPFASTNRRITIMMLKEAPVLPPELSP
jgi:chemotaxis protein MotB